MNCNQTVRVRLDRRPGKTSVRRKWTLNGTRSSAFKPAFMPVSRTAVGWLVTGFAGFGACLALPGCSPDSSCQTTRTCPRTEAGQGGLGSGLEAGAPSKGATAGAAPNAGGPSNVGGANAEAGASGESGAGGDANQPSSTACINDADCSNGLACDGIERCNAGTCLPGAPACANPEPAHCDSVCEEQSGKAACSVRGQDRDKDSHFASSCVTNPGDDCDDAAPTVHPGAPELCDGLDNDCNGKSDLNDGLGAGGTSVPIGPALTSRSLARIAWAAELSAYGIAYRNASTSQNADLYFEKVDQSGKITLIPTALNDSSSKASLNAELSLAWGGGAFGAAWTASNGLYVTNIGPSGGLLGPATYLNVNYFPGKLDLARAPDGSAALLYQDDLLLAAPISAQGLVGGSKQVSFYTNAFSISTAGSSFVIASTGGNHGGPQSDLTLWSSDLANSTELPSYFEAKLASGSSGFALVGRPKDGGIWQFSSYKLDGTSQCGPLNLPPAFLPASLVSTPNGYLVISSGALRAQEVLANCTLGVTFDIDPGPASDVHAASGANGFGIVWQNTTTGIPMRRVFSSRYCD